MENQWLHLLVCNSNLYIYFSGTALAELKMYEKALSEFEAADKILPNNEGIKSNIKRIESLALEHDSEESESD